MGWHGARLSFVALFLVALFRATTVNLAELATVWGGNVEEASNYKRMQRFLKSFDVSMDTIAKMVMSIAGIPQPWVLSIDRTNWSFGTTHFNILMLCVVYEGIGYPLMWTMLEKKRGILPWRRLLKRFSRWFLSPKGLVLSIRRARRERRGSARFAIFLVTDWRFFVRDFKSGISPRAVLEVFKHLGSQGHFHHLL